MSHYTCTITIQQLGTICDGWNVYRELHYFFRATDPFLTLHHTLTHHSTRPRNAPTPLLLHLMEVANCSLSEHETLADVQSYKVHP